MARSLERCPSFHPSRGEGENWNKGLGGWGTLVSSSQWSSEHSGHRHFLASRRPLPAHHSSHGFMATSHFKSIKICHALPLCPTPHWGYGRDMCESCFGFVLFFRWNTLSLVKKSISYHNNSSHRWFSEWQESRHQCKGAGVASATRSDELSQDLAVRSPQEGGSAQKCVSWWEFSEGSGSEWLS